MKPTSWMNRTVVMAASFCAFTTAMSGPATPPPEHWVTSTLKHEIQNQDQQPACDMHPATTSQPQRASSRALAMKHQ
jgi:hypothetical protein